MSVGERFQRLIAAATRRPVATLVTVAVLAAAGGLLALSLKPSAGIDTFVSQSSPSYQATVDDQRHFGQDAVIVLIHEPLTGLVQTKDLATLTELEACFAGATRCRTRAFARSPSPAHTPPTEALTAPARSSSATGRRWSCTARARS